MGWEDKIKLKDEELRSPETNLAEYVEKLLATNPEFAQVTRLTDLVADQGQKDDNFLERKYQRPVGYAATTRVHAGRLCVPMLNDSGATCACLTEEQVILIINHTMTMLAQGTISKTDYNFPLPAALSLQDSRFPSRSGKGRHYGR